MNNRPGRGRFGPGRGMHAVEKAKDFKGAWRKLIRYCQPYLGTILLCMALSSAAVVITIYGPSRLGEITDLIMAGFMGDIDLGTIQTIGMLLGALYVAAFIANFAQGFLMATVTQRIAKCLRKNLAEKINRLPLKYFDSNTIGDILSRVTNDVDMIAHTFNMSVVNLISATVMFLGTLFMMFYYQWLLALTAVASTLIGFVLMGSIMKNSQKFFDRQQEKLGELNGQIEEVYSGHAIVRVYNGTASAQKTFDEVNEKLFASAWKSQFLSGLMQPIMGFIGNFGYALVCVVGAALILDDAITFGVIVKFMIYIRLFTQPLSQIAQAMNGIQSTAAAAERVFEFLEEEELEAEEQRALCLEKAVGQVEFQRVRFGYAKEKPIIKDFSAKVKAGQKVAIVGPTGAGKTTLVNLLMRFYEADGGRILIDGVTTKDMTRANLHEQFCMVLQDTWLFEGTIKENIRYNKTGISDEKIIEACKAVGIHHFIRALPEGYDTVLTDNSSFSVGQKQLLTIARAMVADAPLLILDEATSSVDTRTEILIQKSMDRLMAGRTSFVIAHRLSTIKNADLILYLQDGDVRESGTHEELLDQDGLYAGLYNSQFL